MELETTKLYLFEQVKCVDSWKFYFIDKVSKYFKIITSPREHESFFEGDKNIPRSFSYNKRLTFFSETTYFSGENCI